MKPENSATLQPTPIRICPSPIVHDRPCADCGHMNNENAPSCGRCGSGAC